MASLSFKSEHGFFGCWKNPADILLRHPNHAIRMGRFSRTGRTNARINQAGAWESSFSLERQGCRETALIGDSLAGRSVRNVQFKFQNLQFISQCRSVQPQDLRSL